MKLYFAGNVVAGEEHLHAAGIKNRLLSFAELDVWGKHAFEFWVRDQAPEGCVFLDSGAFGAYTRGAVIDIQRYCQFIKDNARAIHVYASLDVIRNATGSAKNFKIMRDEGLDPIPTFHRGSLHYYLHSILAESPYIALGGVVSDNSTEATLTPFFDECWRIIREYWPRKVHVFGVTAQWALERYPFYSADSSSAIVGAGMGRVQSFVNGRLVSIPWVTYARNTYDGDAMDGVALSQAKKGSAHMGRRCHNVQAVLALERHVTDVWSRKGVTWDEQGNYTGTTGAYEGPTQD